MKIGWKVFAMFKICLHTKDLELLHKIQSFFGKIRRIFITSTRTEASYTVSNLRELSDVLIPHFSKYPLQSAKSVDFLLWCQCVQLIKSKEHLTHLGLSKLISIKGALNLGLTDKLIENFPEVKPIIRPPFIINDLPLNPYWISGFSEGDGSFYISIRSSNNQVRAFYSIGLNEREYNLLVKIQSFFGGIGKIVYNTSNNSVNFNVTRVSELTNVIIPHFEVYNLIGNKLPNYLIWFQIIKLINQKHHLTSAGLNEIKDLVKRLSE